MTSQKAIFCVAILSAGTLLLESTLTRLLAVAQFYHFSFLVVSLALLGFGASGTLLSVVPRFREISLARLLSMLGLGFVFSTGLAFAVINLLPFDSYSIAWDRRQILLFAFYYLTLTFPFMMSGLGVGAALSTLKEQSNRVYAANLIGSGLGAVLAPVILWMAGVPGAVLVSGMSGLLLPFALQKGWLRRWVAVILIGGIIALVGLTSLNFQMRQPIGLTVSPYKGLAQVRRIPDSQIIFSRWNAITHLAVIANAKIHQLPGLSYLYPDLPPPQYGISIDADALQAITLTTPKEFAAADYLPESLAFRIILKANVLILEPGAGLGILQALAGEANQVTAVVENALLLQAIAQSAPEFNVYAYPQVQVLHEPTRRYLQRANVIFDVIFLPLTDAYRPVASGAYSLGEDYSLTVEAFEAIFQHLDPNGVFIMTRWIQMPPSEGLRTVNMLVEALERSSELEPASSMVIYRGIQTITILIRPTGWTPEMLTIVRKFMEERKFDLIWLPGIQEWEVNRFNKLSEPIYYLTIRDLFNSKNRTDIIAQYPYNLTPPTDDQPFFFHFFKWRQIPDVLAALGHTWQPFGGSGYLVLVALLVLTLSMSAILILLPLFTLNWNQTDYAARWYVLLYFGLIGIAFLFVEIPLIQKWILFLGNPTYAFTAVVATLLIFSGIGSAISRVSWLPRRTVLIFLPILALLTSFGLSQISDFILGWSAWVQIGMTVFCLAPLGIWMGFPFPLGLSWMQNQTPGWEPWAWAVNGCTSVVASVLAAMLSLSAGFSFVVILGACAYAGAAGLYLFMWKNQ